MRDDPACDGNGRYWHRRCPRTHVPAGRISSSEPSATPFSASSSATARGASNGCRRWVDTCSRPTISPSGPVAARDGALPAPLPALHGEGRALLVPARAVHCRLRGISGQARRKRHGCLRRDQALSRGPYRRHVPRGTRREKGLRKKHTARWRSGAARIALEAGVPLVPAGIAGTDELSRLGRLRVAYGEPIELGDLSSMALEDAAHAATDRLSAAIAELEGSLS